jgi:hypothetical protein
MIDSEARIVDIAAGKDCEESRELPRYPARGNSRRVSDQKQDLWG